MTVTDMSGAAIAMRLTNRNGLLNSAIPIEVPDRSASQSPNTMTIPYATVNLYARAPDYEAIEIEEIQIFADTNTVQTLKFIPLSELPGNWNKTEIFVTQSQNL